MEGGRGGERYERCVCTCVCVYVCGGGEEGSEGGREREV